MRRVPILTSLVVLVACGGGDQAPPSSSDNVPAEDRGSFQAIALTGDSLFANPSEQTISVQTPLLEEALAELEADPTQPEALIWVGRRLAYLGRYDEAIERFTTGIADFPEDPRFYRHRGHRYLSTRQLDRAIEDFATAARLVEGQEDVIEPDGLPNAAGIPLSTLQFNIWYHYGLAHFLKGEYEQALEFYQNCRSVSTNDDLIVAVDYWTYMTLMRLDRPEEAAELAAAVTPDLELIENDNYKDLLLLFSGQIGEESVVGDDGDALAGATKLYGVVNWHLFEGRDQEATATLDRLLSLESQWASFGYLAGEADRARDR